MHISFVRAAVAALAISLTSAAFALPPMTAQHAANQKFQQFAEAQVIFPHALIAETAPGSLEGLCIRDDMTMIEGFVDMLVTTQGLIELGDKLKDPYDIKQADAFVAESLVALKRTADALAGRAASPPSKCAASPFYTANPDALKTPAGLATDIVALLSQN